MSYQGVNNNYQLQKPFGMNTAAAALAMTNPNNLQMGAQIDTQAAVDAMSDNFVGNRIKEYGEVDPNKQLAATFPILLAINAGMDKYMKLYDGPYEKSLAGRIGNFGDKVSEFLFEKNPVGRFLVDTKNRLMPWAQRNIYEKSALLKAFGETPSKPEFELAVQQLDMFRDFAAKDYVNAVEEYLKPLKSVKDFNALGADKQTIQRIEQAMANAATPEASAKIFWEEQYKLLKPNATAVELSTFSQATNKAELLQNLKLKSLHIADMAELNAIKAAPQKHMAEILTKLEKTDPKLFARIWTSDRSFFTKIGNFLYGRNVSFQRVRNTILSIGGKGVSPHTSALGRGLNRAVTYITEGATGRVFNGKLSTIMQAYFVAEALLMANKQEKTSDKIKSFAERMTELIGFLVFMPPAIKLMHRIGGLKNAGMTPEQVKIYEDAVVEFNKKVADGFYKGNKKAYKFGLNRLKVLGRPKTKNPITWIGRKIGDFVTCGLKTTIRPYSKYTHQETNLNLFDLLMKNTFNGKAWKKFITDIPHRMWDAACNPKYWGKRVAGWGIRLAIATSIMSFFNKIAVKCVHAIIGKPKYSLLDEDKVKEQQEKEIAEQTQQIQQQQNEQQQSTSVLSQKPINPNELSDSNLIKQAANGQTPQNSFTPQLQDGKQLEEKRTYIPSPVGMVPKQVDMTALNEAFAQADAAEAEIQNILARKY